MHSSCSLGPGSARSTTRDQFDRGAARMRDHQEHCRCPVSMLTLCLPCQTWEFFKGTYTSRIALKSEVAATMNAKIASLIGGLHVVLEVKDVVPLCEQVGDILLSRPARRHPRADIPLHAPRVVVVRGVHGNNLGLLQGGRYGAQVDRVIGKGPRLDAATAAPGWDIVCDVPVLESVGEVMRLELAVAAEATNAAVEERRVDGVACPLAPVPVRLVTRVATLVTQRTLKGPDKVPMERQEVGCEVNRERLGYMWYVKVIETALGARILGVVVSRGQGHQAVYCIGVVDALADGQVPPVQTSCFSNSVMQSLKEVDLPFSSLGRILNSTSLIGGGGHIFLQVSESCRSESI